MSTSVTFTSHSAEIKDLMKKAQKNGLEAIGFTAESYAKRNIQDNRSVITGRLLNSITHKVEGDAVYIGTNVEYAPFVEFGTSKRKAKPYLKPACENHSAEYKDLLKAAMQANGF